MGSSGTEAVYVAPRTPIEKTLARIWCNVLGLKKIGIHDDFFNLGGHSSRAVRMIGEVNRALGQKLSVAVFFDNPTIEGMARLLQHEKQAASETQLMPISSPYVVPIRSEGSTPPLFLVHGVGGRVLGFYALTRHLEPDQRVYGIEYVISDSEPAMLSLEDLAARYIGELRKVQPEGPYYFLGYSFGGMLVFEMAQQLNAMGQTVGLLGMVDTPMIGASLQSRRGLMRAVKGRLQAFNFHGRRVFRGPARWNYIREEASRRGGDLTARVRARIYARLTAWGRPIPKFLERAYAVNWFASHRYRARRYPGNVTLFRASSEEGAVDERGYKLGWKPFAGGSVEIHEIPGTHFDIIREPNVQLLARELTACLNRLYEQWPGQQQLLVSGGGSQ
ncbi:MAG: thioesterase domain-containing protein [Candidatus Binataceae bacterium]